MNCQQFQDVLQGLARRESLEDSVLKDALEHAESCSVCEDLLKEAEALNGDLRSLAALDASEQTPMRVEKAVQEAFRRNRIPPDRAPAPHAPDLRLVAVTSLIGIAALALFTIFLMRRWQPAPSPEGYRPSSPTIPAARPSNGREEASLAEPFLPADLQDDALFAFEDEEGATGSFVPLNETFDPTALEGGTVLRVAVPRGTLRTFGFSVEQSADERVLADMIVTGDGTPQAIRLVGR